MSLETIMTEDNSFCHETFVFGGVTPYSQINQTKMKVYERNKNSFTQQLQALLRIMLYLFSCVWGTFILTLEKINFLLQNLWN